MTAWRGRQRDAGVRRRRVAIAFAVLGLLPLIAMPFITSAIATDALANQVAARSSGAASSIALYVDQVILGRVAVVDGLTPRTDIGDAVNAASPGAAATALATIAHAVPAQTGALLATTSGRILASTATSLPAAPGLIVGDWLTGVLAGDTAIVPAPPSATSELVLAAPVRGHGGSVDGILVVTSSTADIASAITDFSSSAGLGITVVDAADDTIVRTGAGAAAISASDATAATASGATAQASTVETSDGQMSVVLVAAHSSRWLIRVALPVDTVLAPVASLEESMVLVSLALVALFVAGIRLVRRALAERDMMAAALAARMSPPDDGEIGNPSVRASASATGQRDAVSQRAESATAWPRDDPQQQ